MIMERRQFGRRELVQTGLIEAPLRQPIACEVRNISTQGALLSFDAREYVPARFHLRMSTFLTACHVIHRGRGYTGVVFEAAYQEEQPEPAPQPVAAPKAFTLGNIASLFARPHR